MGGAPSGGRTHTGRILSPPSRCLTVVDAAARLSTAMAATAQEPRRLASCHCWHLGVAVFKMLDKVTL